MAEPPDGDDLLARPPAEPRLIFPVLAAHEIDYLLVGGLAVIAHGYPRLTQDVDILPSPDRPNLTRLAAALRELDAASVGARGEHLSLDLSHPESLGLGNYFLATRYGALDLVNGSRPDLRRYRALAASAIETTVAGATVRVISKSDLIDLKREAGRPKDLRDIDALTAFERENEQGG